MTKDQLNALMPGDAVINKHGGCDYLVNFNLGDHVIISSVIELRDGDEKHWDLLREQPPELTLAEKIEKAACRGATKSEAIEIIQKILDEHETEKMKDKQPG